MVQKSRPNCHFNSVQRPRGMESALLQNVILITSFRATRPNLVNRLKIKCILHSYRYENFTND